MKEHHVSFLDCVELLFWTVVHDGTEFALCHATCSSARIPCSAWHPKRTLWTNNNSVPFHSTLSASSFLRTYQTRVPLTSGGALQDFERKMFSKTHRLVATLFSIFRSHSSSHSTDEGPGRLVNLIFSRTLRTGCRLLQFFVVHELKAAHIRLLLLQCKEKSTWKLFAFQLRRTFV